jgi:hypothetical protein
MNVEGVPTGGKDQHPAPIKDAKPSKLRELIEKMRREEAEKGSPDAQRPGFRH